MLQLMEMTVIYDESEPVLYRKDADAESLDGIHFCFGDKAFISDESEDYEFYILNSNCCDSDTWIIQDMMSGNIRVWDVRKMMLTQSNACSVFIIIHYKLNSVSKSQKFADM